MINKGKISIKAILTFLKQLFILFLIFYLVLFFLESIFPGIVSNNFNLNWVLFSVIFLGVVSIFTPEESKELLDEKETNSEREKEIRSVDENYIKQLEIHYSLFPFSKSLLPKTSLLIDKLLSIFNHEQKWIHFNPSTRKRNMIIKRWIILFVLVFIVIIGYKSMLVFKNNNRTEKHLQAIVKNTEIVVNQEKIVTSPFLTIKFLNGNGLEGEGTKMNNLATSSGFLTLEASNAAYYKYPKTLIFYKSKKEDAEKVATIVAQRYPKYDILEATQSYEANVTVILGRR